MNCGIAVFPTKEVQDFANSYRKRFDPHYSLINPHLTIRDKEDWTDEQLAAAVNHLEIVAASFSPFTLHFNRFTSLYPSTNTIIIGLEDRKSLDQLHDAVCSESLCIEDSMKHLYHPYLAIGQQMSNDELHDVLASLSKIPVNYTSEIDRIHLLYQTENGAWTTYQTFKFKG
ncbi:hypothetical protein E0485_22285 [Paenibacillus albiflavus]|uniref:Phosphoesterase n=1 Tax=Paenibacillus albiflavus TaxID=2545760 RepID=A0A4R4DZY6_9BACL|nr:2'-5' RNA ligase family protein [Paenibacillus albiflavus]TCZ72319.1 hypothetical protein E0485_22285 [Paenibacillus albiflavus]